jgi:hypothetical protein
VVNSHQATNLRDDIDAIAAAVTGLRDEIRSERLERIESDRRIEQIFRGGGAS